MPDSFTPNYNLVLQVTGSNPGTWGTDLNNNLISPLDLSLGGTFGVSSSGAALTLAQWQNKAFKITGALAGDVQLILPLSPNSIGSATAVGGHFIVDNETTGAHNITVLTAATGSTGVTVSQGSRTELYSDTVNVWYADDSRTAKVNSFAGNPNGNVAGSAASVNNPADVILDRTNVVGYVCTTTGNAAGAVWSSITGQVPPPQGYLTPVSGTPIITGDSVAATTIYYTPYMGDLLPIWTGSTFGLFHFAELALALSAGSQVASGLYDVFGFIDSAGTKLPQVAFGPSWGAGTGGNQAAGTCARGTGAGGTALQRKNGLLTNAATITAANNGASTFNIPANQGTYLGTLFIDSSAGQVTCHRSWGSSRKFGIWNAYNRVPIILQGGDSAASWNYTSATVRESNGSTTNVLTVLCGLGEENISTSFTQNVNGSGAEFKIGVGWNSTTAFSGTVAHLNGVAGLTLVQQISQYDNPPALGINNVTSLEALLSGGSTAFFGTQANMNLRAQYRG